MAGLKGCDEDSPAFAHYASSDGSLMCHARTSPAFGSAHVMALAQKVRRAASMKRAVQMVRRRLIAIALVSCTVGSGMMVLMLSEGWEPITALYFLVQVTTTIGYGDITVGSDVAKGFMSVYVLSLLIVVAYFYQLLGQNLIARHSERILDAIRSTEAHLSGESKARTRTRFARLNRVLSAGCLFAVALFSGAAFYRLVEHCSCGTGPSRVPGCWESDFRTCAASGGHVMTWTSSLYMAVITLTTVGFGDHVPRTLAGQTFACAWMLLGVAATANFLASMSEMFFHICEDRRLALALDLDWRTFRMMDKNRDGVLSRAEYQCFMLVTHGLVSQDVLDEIDREFDALDTRGDERVTYEMVAKRKRQRP